MLKLKRTNEYIYFTQLMICNLVLKLKNSLGETKHFKCHRLNLKYKHYYLHTPIIMYYEHLS